MVLFDKRDGIQRRWLLRVRGTQRARVADAAAAGLDGAHAPFVLACCVALVVLSTAAQVGGRRGLLRGHGLDGTAAAVC